MTRELDALDVDARLVLERRAERLRAPLATEDDASIVWVATFPMSGDEHAIALDRLRGVVPVRAVTPVPLAPPEVIGVLRFQGQILAAFSLAALLGTRGWQSDPTVLLVVECDDGQLVAIDCEQTPRATSIPARAITEGASRSVGAVTEVTLADLTQLRLLDVTRVVSSRRRGSAAPTRARAEEDRHGR